MTPKEAMQEIPLIAKNPFELRVNLGRDVPESAVRSALASGDMGFLHSFTTGSTVDGPGVRLVAWTTGCAWRCLYCHNPDTWNVNNGFPVTLAKAEEALRKYCHGLKALSGGFTLSGGEPLLQDRFAARLFAAAKAMRIHTALDTSGALGNRLSDAELETIDLVLLDIKAWDLEHHRRLTGMDNGPVLAFARRMAARNRPLWLRYVLVPGWTDNPDEIAHVASFAAGLKSVERVDVLPFHQRGSYKWIELGMQYKLQHVAPPSPEAIEKARTRFRSVGLKAH